MPARVSESGDYLVSFGEPTGRIAFDALAIDAREAAKQECEAHPGRAPAEVPERIRNWDRSLRNACGLVGAAAGRVWPMVSGRPSRGPTEGARQPVVTGGAGSEVAAEPTLSLEAESGAWAVSEPDLDPICR